MESFGGEDIGVPELVELLERIAAGLAALRDETTEILVPLDEPEESTAFGEQLWRVIGQHSDG